MTFVFSRCRKRNCLAVVFLVLCLAVLSFKSAFADGEDVLFTINNTNSVLELAIPSVINMNLTPTSGTAFDTTNLNIGIGTNNATGYSLSMTASSADLIHISGAVQNNPSVISSITNSVDLATFENSADTPNKWGYKRSDESTFKAVTPSTAIPLKTTNSPSNATGNDVVLNFAVKVDSALASGTYSTTLNFTAVTNYVPRLYMQDMTLSSCQKNVGTNGNPSNVGDNIYVYDRRDENSYTVRYINGQCWMTRNLRLTGIVSATDSNFSGENFNVSEYSLDFSDASFSGHCDSENGFNYACAKDSGSAITGVWYNYYAAKAGTVSGSSNTTNTASDICPSGWHLPSGPNTTTGTNYNRLIGNTISGWQDATVGLTAFGAVGGGRYFGDEGSLVFPTTGAWWGNGANTVMHRYYLVYENVNNRFYGQAGIERFAGVFIRCVLD